MSFTHSTSTNNAVVNAGITICQMSEEDYNNVVRPWTILENWNPGCFDSQIYFSHPEGRFFYVLKKLNEIVAALLGYAYNSNHATVGCYIVKPGERGRGYGKQLWDCVLNSLCTRYHNVRLYSVPALIAAYQKEGFILENSSIQHWQRVNGSPIAPFHSPNIQVATHQELLAICEYDQSIFPAQRHSLLKALLNLPESSVIYSRAPHSGLINGFGAIRLCEEGYRIGPLYADSPSIARELICKLLSSRRPDNMVFMDSHNYNQHAAKLLTNHFHFTHTKEKDCFPMYRGAPLPMTHNAHKHYGEMALDLGY